MTTRTTNKKRTGPKVDRAAEQQERTTARIIASIEQGIADPAKWSAPWHNEPAPMPVNVSTGKHYNGGNLVALWFAVADGASPYWGTYKQWQGMNTAEDLARAADPLDSFELPIHVRKGETAAEYILRPRIKTETNPETGKETSRLLGMSPHAVFHAGQVEGWTEPERAPMPTHTVDERADIAACFAWMATTGAKVSESAREGASYSPTFDRVTMPDRDRFTTGHGAWSTGAHELCHWTSHPDRLNRTETSLIKRFGDDSYAAEELVAELGAAFTLAALGRTTEPREDHAHYLAHWLRVLKSRPDALWTVASKASKAAEYLIDRSDLIHLTTPAETVDA